MRSLLATPIALAALTFTLAGCPDRPASPPAQKAPAAPTAQPNPDRPAEPAGTPSAPPTASPDGGQANATPQPEPSAPAELPQDDPNARMYVMMDRVFELLASHRNDCERARGEVEAYLNQHRAEFRQLKAQADALERSRSAEENKRYRALLIRRGQGTIQTQMKSMMAFHQQCPDQMVQITEMIKALTSPAP